MAIEQEPEFSGSDRGTAVVLGSLRGEAHQAAQLEIRKFRLTLEWAELNQVSAEDAYAHHQVCGFGDQGLPIAGAGAPLVSEFALYEFGAALSLSSEGARKYVGCVLEIGHRLPRLRERVLAGQVPYWRAARVAEATMVLCPEGAGAVDASIAAFAHSCSWAQLDRTVAAAAARFDPDPDAEVTLRPVIDLEEHHHVEAYEVPTGLQTQADLIDLHCVFPYCTRAAIRCDHDHVKAYESGGTTCSCNIAPLCRGHHRAKTHSAWTYDVLEPGRYLWTSPHGLHLIRDHHGTHQMRPERHDLGQDEPPEP